MKAVRTVSLASACVLLCVVACSCTCEPDERVVAHWTFDGPVSGGAVDAIGGLSGVGRGVTEVGDEGAWHFHGGEALVVVPHDSALDLGDGFIIETSFRFDGLGRDVNVSGYQSLVEKHKYGGYVMYISPTGRIVYWFETPDGRVADSTAAPLAPGPEWRDVGFTWDGSEMRVIVDGEVVHSAPFPGPLLSTSQELFIGNDDTENWGLRGDIRDVRILSGPHPCRAE